jgi:hypothetical protein
MRPFSTLGVFITSTSGLTKPFVSTSGLAFTSTSGDLAEPFISTGDFTKSFPSIIGLEKLLLSARLWCGSVAAVRGDFES